MAANLLGAVKGQGEAGNHDYDYGDSLNYDLTLRYRVSPADVGPSPNRWFLTFGVAGELRSRKAAAQWRELCENVLAQAGVMPAP